MRQLACWGLLCLIAVPASGQDAYLKASNTHEFDEFGWAIATSGDTLVVGAPHEDSGATGVNGDEDNQNAPQAGAVYVFVRSGSTWIQQAYLKASNTDTTDEFGTSLALSGDTLVVGARFEAGGTTGVGGDQDDDTAWGSGAAYVFVRDGTTWTQQAYLKASNTDAGDAFGESVGISGDTIVVGAIHERSQDTGVGADPSDNSLTTAGAAYVFVRDGTTWSQQAYLKASNTQLGDAPFQGDAFGDVVAISGDTIVVGALHEDSPSTGVNGSQGNGAQSSGAAYVFVRDGTTWSQQAYIKASNAQAQDFFGASVSVSGDTIAVGASRERGGSSGVNGDENDNSAFEAGAAYIFVRNATTWTQQAYIKASNTDNGDQFGGAVDLRDDALIVGAFFEDSNATGVNGDETDNSAIHSGAAYVFLRSGTTWSQQAYLKSSSPEEIDLFGQSVATAGDTFAVGAYVEDSSAVGVDGDPDLCCETNSGAAYTYELAFSAWLDLGDGLAGSGGLTPLLVGSGALVGGSPVALDLSDARPSSQTTLVLGFSALHAPLKGGVLVPAPDVLRFNFATDLTGELHLAATWPVGVPREVSFWTQLWVTDPAGPAGFAASNALIATTP